MTNSVDVITPEHFRSVVGQFPTGVVVVTATVDGVAKGMSCNSFTSVSLEPPLVGFFPARSSSSWPVMRQAGRFTVNVLADHHEEISRQFSRSGVDRFADVPWTLGEFGPVLSEAAAWIECELYAESDAGDHSLVLGEVKRMSIDHDSLPLVFHRGQYGKI